MGERGNDMELPGKVVLITGVSGFVGGRTACRLLQEGSIRRE
jgi:nucleoside-diphosphate-sugar epimerase